MGHSPHLIAQDLGARYAGDPGLGHTSHGVRQTWKLCLHPRPQQGPNLGQRDARFLEITFKAVWKAGSVGKSAFCLFR